MLRCSRARPFANLCRVGPYPSGFPQKARPRRPHRRRPIPGRALSALIAAPPVSRIGRGPCRPGPDSMRGQGHEAVCSGIRCRALHGHGDHERACGTRAHPLRRQRGRADLFPGCRQRWRRCLDARPACPMPAGRIVGALHIAPRTGHDIACAAGGVLRRVCAGCGLGGIGAGSSGESV